MAHSTPSSNFEPQFSNMPTPGHAAAESLRRRPKIGTVKNILAFSKALEVRKSAEKTVAYVLN